MEACSSTTPSLTSYLKPPFFGIRQYPGGLLLCHSPKTDMSDTEVDLTVEVPSSLKQNKW